MPSPAGPPTGAHLGAINRSTVGSETELVGWLVVTFDDVPSDIPNDIPSWLRGVHIVNWLVVPTPLEKMKVSWDDETPNIWNRNMLQTTNQCGYDCSCNTFFRCWSYCCLTYVQCDMCTKPLGKKCAETWKVHLCSPYVPWRVQTCGSNHRSRRMGPLPTITFWMWPVHFQSTAGLFAPPLG